MKLNPKMPDALAQVGELLIQSDLVPEGLEKENLTLFYQSNDLGRIVGVIGIELYKDACLLRSLAVRSDRRNLGIARTLIHEALSFAHDAKCFDVYLITETISETMRRYGFTDITREKVPADLARSPFFNGICPCSSQVLHKNIAKKE